MKISKTSKLISVLVGFFLITSINIFAQDKSDEYQEELIITSKTKKSNSVSEIFSSNQKDYNFYDSIELSTGTFTFGIKHRKAEVFVDTETQKAGIQTYYQTSFFNFIFEEKDINLIAKCYEKYLQDFDNKVLIRNKSIKTRKIYTNNGECRVEWGTLKSMMNNFGDTKFFVGYEFKDNSPYFCIIIKEADNLLTNMGSYTAEKSVEVQLYFTKAEAKQFLNVLSPEVVKVNIPTNFSISDTY